MISNAKKKIRCAIYTRKSHEEGLDQDFNSLDAQRSAAEAYVQSQVHEGWKLSPTRYDDGGFSGGNMDRPALNALIDDIRARKIDCVVVYKVEGIRSKVYETKTGKTRGGDLLSARSIHNILTDAKYIGRIVHKGVSYQAEHPAIVSDELFEQVRQTLASNRTYTHKHQAKRFALLRRLIYCGECGSLVLPAWTNNHGREYRYYTCSKKVKSGYQKCALPSLPAGELEKIVVEQLRSNLRHPDVIAHTFREVSASANGGLDAAALSRLEELRTRRQQAEQAARSLLGLHDPESPFVKSELKRLNAEMKSLDDSIRGIESGGTQMRKIGLSEVTEALQRLDPVWEVLYPEEQARILQLLVEQVTVSKHNVDIHFRANGIEQIVDELTPMSERADG